jgi:hypothetical protein
MSGDGARMGSMKDDRREEHVRHRH